MPLKIEWLIPYRIIDERLSGKLSPDEFTQVSQTVVAMLAEADREMPGKLVYLLLDASEVESMPPPYLMLRQALPVLRLKNRGLMVHVTRKALVRNMIELTAHVMRFRMQAFSDRDQAIEALMTAMIDDDIRDARL